MAKVTTAGAVAGWFRKYAAAPRYVRSARVRLVAADGVRLSAARLEGPPGAPFSVVLLHGFVNWSRTPRIHAFAHRLAADVPVVVPDLRGHGRSAGTCTMGIEEPLDVEAAVDAARRAWGLPVVTVGVSLGAASALLHAGSHGGVAGVFAISSPAWWGDTGREGSARVHRWVSTRHGRLVLRSLLRTRIAASCEALPDAIALVGEIAPAFTVVVHDPEDWYFGPEHAEALHAAAREPRALWWQHGAGHGSDLLDDALAARLLAHAAAAIGASPDGDAALAPG